MPRSSADCRLVELDAAVLERLPEKVQVALRAVIQAHLDGLYGHVEIHYKGGDPRQMVRRETEPL